MYIHYIIFISLFFTLFRVNIVIANPKLVPHSQPIQRPPSKQITLHYHQPVQNGASYQGIVDFDLRETALVIGQSSILKSIECTPLGIRLIFKSKAFAAETTRNWSRPLIVVVLGRQGSCAEDEDAYHPIRLVSVLSPRESDAHSVWFQGYRSSWEVAAFHHRIRIFQLHDRVVQSSSLATSTKQFVDHGRQLVPDLPILKSSVEQILCRNCYLSSRMKLELDVSLPVYNPAKDQIMKILEILGEIEGSLRYELGSETNGIQTIVDELLCALQTYFRMVFSIISATSHSKTSDEVLVCHKRNEELNQTFTGVNLAVYGFRHFILGPALPISLKTLVPEVGTLEDKLNDKPLSNNSQITISRLLDTLENFIQIEYDRARDIVNHPINETTSITGFPSIFHDSIIPNHLSIAIKGDLMFNAGISATRRTAGNSKTDKVNLLSVGLVGLSIPKIIDIVPFVKIYANTSAYFIKPGTKLVSAQTSWEAIDTSITFGPSNHTSKETWDFSANHSYLRHRNTRYHRSPTRKTSDAAISADASLRADVLFELKLGMIQDQFALGLRGMVGYATDASHQESCTSRSFNISSSLETVMDAHLTKLLNLFAGNNSEKAIALRQISPIDTFEECD